MKKDLKIFITFAFLLIVLSLGLSRTAHASNYDQTDISSGYATSTSLGITFDPTADGTTTSFTITSVDFGMSPTNNTCTGTTQLVIKDYGSNTQLATSSISVFPGMSEMYFPLSTPLPVTARVYLFVDNTINGNTEPSCSALTWSDHYDFFGSSGATASTYYSPYITANGTPPKIGIPAITMNGTPGPGAISYSVAFSPHFTPPTATTTDFTTWLLDLTAPPATTTLEYGVNYKIATSTDFQYDDNFILTNPFINGINGEPAYGVLKATNLEPGNTYTAVAYIASVTRTSTTTLQNILATSSPLTINVVTGSPTTYPGVTLLGPPLNWGDQWCTPSLFVVSSVDIGQNVCKTVVNLIVPNPSDLQNIITTFDASLNSHIPFSTYNQALQLAATYSPSGSPTTLMNFRLKIDAANIDIQEHWFDVSDPHFLTVWAYPKTLIEYSLWLFLFTYLVYRTTTIFKAR